MYQVSEQTRAQFEKMMSLEPVKEALRFIEEDQPNAIGEQREENRRKKNRREKNRRERAGSM